MAQPGRRFQLVQFHFQPANRPLLCECERDGCYLSQGRGRIQGRIAFQWRRPAELQWRRTVRRGACPRNCHRKTALGIQASQPFARWLDVDRHAGSYSVRTQPRSSRSTRPREHCCGVLRRVVLLTPIRSRFCPRASNISQFLRATPCPVSVSIRESLRAHHEHNPGFYSRRALGAIDSTWEKIALHM